MKKETPNKADVYKPVWTPNDTILTLYCAKYPNKINRLGFHPTSNETALEELANHAIGSTGFSLKRQIGNVEYLMGKNDTQYSVSNIQKKVYDEYNHLSEDELHAICMGIVDNVPASVYEEFEEKRKVIEGIKTAENMKKTKEFFQKESELRLIADMKRLGKDPSKLKFVGRREL